MGIAACHSVALAPDMSRRLHDFFALMYEKKHCWLFEVDFKVSDQFVGLSVITKRACLELIAIASRRLFSISSDRIAICDHSTARHKAHDRVFTLQAVSFTIGANVRAKKIHQCVANVLVNSSRDVFFSGVNRYLIQIIPCLLAAIVLLLWCTFIKRG